MSSQKLNNLGENSGYYLDQCKFYEINKIHRMLNCVVYLLVLYEALYQSYKKSNRRLIIFNIPTINTPFIVTVNFSHIKLYRESRNCISNMRYSVFECFHKVERERKVLVDIYFLLLKC